MKKQGIYMAALSTTLMMMALATMAAHQPKKTFVAGTGWFASFDDAKAEAKRLKKPVLLLSMFGKLDEEMPCANARTLRATLFKSPEFKNLAEKDVVLAWEMVRAVPKVQIDLGDGRKVTRTVRGNAVMYLCNTDGKVVDAYPGVYTAGDFIPMVRESIKVLAKADTSTVIDYHRKRGNSGWRGPITLGKAVVEAPTLNLIGAKTIMGKVTEDDLNDPAKRSFLLAAKGLRDMSLTPMTPDEVVFAVTGKAVQGQQLADLAQDILQKDSATNMERVRPVVHLYFASEKTLPTPLQARDAILESILKIPYKDPYFGLKDVMLPGTDH